MRKHSLQKGERVAFITGGSRGLGRDITLTLAREGIQVAFTYLKDVTAAKQTVAEIHQYHDAALAVKADVRDYKAVQRTIKKVMTTFGRIDILVNNVGEFLQKAFADLTPTDWHNIIASNLNSVFYCCKCIGPIMQKQRYGRVINIGLANAHRKQVFRQIMPYAIAKNGVLILTRSLASEWAPYGITVNVISPGLMNNGSLSALQIQQLQGKVPMGRLGSGADMVAALLYLISDAAAYVTGTEIIVSGGWGLDI